MKSPAAAAADGPSLEILLRNSDPLVLLNSTLYAQIVLALLFLLFAFVVAATANTTFVNFITAVIFISFPLWSYYAIHRWPTHLTIGATLGAGLVVIIVSLQTAVYWGGLSVCEKVNYSIRQYSCNSKVAYRTVSIIAILLFLAQFVFVVLLAQFRLAVLKEVEEYEEISPHEHHYAYDPSDNESPAPASSVTSAHLASAHTALANAGFGTGGVVGGVAPSRGRSTSGGSGKGFQDEPPGQGQGQGQGASAATRSVDL